MSSMNVLSAMRAAEMVTLCGRARHTCGAFASSVCWLHQLTVSISKCMPYMAHEDALMMMQNFFFGLSLGRGLPEKSNTFAAMEMMAASLWVDNVSMSRAMLGISFINEEFKD